MENERLEEIKLALYINHIDKANDKTTYSIVMKILSCFAATISKETVKHFSNLVQNTIGDSMLKASDKELIATCKHYFSNRRSAELLGISQNTFYRKYDDLICRDFNTKEYLESLEPMFKTQEERLMIKDMISFIENFKYALGDDCELSNKERSLEIEFWLIYNRLMCILRNSYKCDMFIFNICNLFNINYSTIAQLKNNVHVINRSYPHFRYNGRYFMQEIVTLYTAKGLSKGTIGSKVLNKGSSFLYNNTNRKYSKIEDKDMDWQYTHTISWDKLDKKEVIKFIKIFHLFISYDI